MTDWLFDTLIWTGALIGVALVLRRPVTRWFGPQLAYALWALPLLRLVLPPITLPADWAPAAVEPIAQVAAIGLDEAELREFAASMPVADASPAALPASSSADLLPSLLPLMLAIWAIGAVFYAARRVQLYLRSRDAILADARQVGRSGDVCLIESPVVSAPLAFGLRRKIVALPIDYIAHEDRAARDLAIAHELAHHERRDVLANFVVQPLFALHWFNPLGWYGWRAFRRDQEAACDARVVEGKSRRARALYAETIASFAGTQGMALAAPMACPVLGETSIVHRLRNLTMTETTIKRRRAGRFLLSGAALALPLTATVGYAAAETSAPDAPVAPSASIAATAPVAPDAPAYSVQAQDVVPASPEALAAREAADTQIDGVRAVTSDLDGGRVVVRLREPMVPPAPSAPPAAPAPGRASYMAHVVGADGQVVSRRVVLQRAAIERAREDAEAARELQVELRRAVMEEQREARHAIFEQRAEELEAHLEAEAQRHAEQSMAERRASLSLTRASIERARAAVLADRNLSRQQRQTALASIEAALDDLECDDE